MTLDHVKDGFRDIGRMIADPLDILRAKDEVDGGRDGSGILHHVGEQLTKQRCIEAIDILITRPDLDGLGHVAIGKTVEHIPELGQDEGRYVKHSSHELSRQIRSLERTYALADVLCEIPNPLEFACDPQDCDRLPQVDGNGVPSRNQRHDRFVDLSLHLVDRGIGGNHPPSPLLIAFTQGLDRFQDLPFDKTAHFRDPARESLQLRTEGRDRMLEFSHCCVVCSIP
jgi:hypothetical protein